MITLLCILGNEVSDRSEFDKIIKEQILFVDYTMARILASVGIAFDPNNLLHKKKQLVTSSPAVETKTPNSTLENKATTSIDNRKSDQALSSNNPNFVKTTSIKSSTNLSSPPLPPTAPPSTHMTPTQNQNTQQNRNTSTTSTIKPMIDSSALLQPLSTARNSGPRSDSNISRNTPPKPPLPTQSRASISSSITPVNINMNKGSCNSVQSSTSRVMNDKDGDVVMEEDNVTSQRGLSSINRSQSAPINSNGPIYRSNSNNSSYNNSNYSGGSNYRGNSNNNTSNSSYNNRPEPPMQINNNINRSNTVPHNSNNGPIYNNNNSSRFSSNLPSTNNRSGDSYNNITRRPGDVGGYSRHGSSSGHGNNFTSSNYQDSGRQSNYSNTNNNYNNGNRNMNSSYPNNSYNNANSQRSGTGDASDRNRPPPPQTPYKR
jgi:hypothetical protein